MTIGKFGNYFTRSRPIGPETDRGRRTRFQDGPHPPQSNRCRQYPPFGLHPSILTRQMSAAIHLYRLYRSRSPSGRRHRPCAASFEFRQHMSTASLQVQARLSLAPHRHSSTKKYHALLAKSLYGRSRPSDPALKHTGLSCGCRARSSVSRTRLPIQRIGCNARSRVSTKLPTARLSTATGPKSV